MNTKMTCHGCGRNILLPMKMKCHTLHISKFLVIITVATFRWFLTVIVDCCISDCSYAKSGVKKLDLCLNLQSWGFEFEKLWVSSYSLQ